MSGTHDRPGSSSNSSTASTDSTATRFIETLDVGLISVVALQARAHHFSRSEGEDQSVECIVHTTPAIGAFNVVYFLSFNDGGPRWVMRLPIVTNEVFGPREAQGMRRDLLAMKMIARNTTFPIPHIIEYSTSTVKAKEEGGNILGTPYSIMTFVEGVLISDVWFDKKWMTEEKRRRIFESLIVSLEKLSKFTFDRIGVLEFADDEETCFASQVPLDEKEGLGHFTSTYSLHLYLIDTFLHDHTPNKSPSGNNNSGSEPGVIFDFDRSMLLLLRIFATMFHDPRYDGAPFVLSPPDFDSQTILVDDEGNVTAFLDWDRVRIGSRLGGFARYPSWITRDWNQLVYGWTAECSSEELALSPSRSGQQQYGQEDSPTALAEYRSLYNEIYRKINPANALINEYSDVWKCLDHAICESVGRDYFIDSLAEHVFGETLVRKQRMNWFKFLKGLDEAVPIFEDNKEEGREEANP